MKLNKDLINKLKNGHIAIDNTGNPNVELLRAVLKEAFPKDTYSYTTIGIIEYYSYNNSDTWRGDNIVNLPTIPLNDFLEKEQFPKDDFGVIVENNNGKEIIDYLVSKGFIKTGWDGSGALHSYGILKDSKGIIYTRIINFSKTYTLQQLKNLENNMENKEIIGYKLIKPEYRGAALMICNTVANWENTREVFDISVKQVGYISRLKEAKVLDLWFEEIYKSKEVVITVNNTVINIKGERMVAEGKEFSIEWLNNIKELFNNRTSKESSWITRVESVTIGCKTGWTKQHLDEIITVYSELQKQK